MKNYLSIFKTCLMAIALVGVSACTDEEKEVLPVFPTEIDEISVKTGDEQKLEFVANLNWELSSDAVWCLFDGESSVMGEAGNQSITFTVTDALWTIEDSSAEITLKMGNQEQVIAKITRLGQPLAVVNDKDAAYNEENPIKLAYKEPVKEKFSFKANFDWTLEEVPAWLTVENLPISATAGQAVEIELSVLGVNVINAQKDVLKFKRKDAEGVCEIPVIYEGMSDTDIEVSGLNASAWWWTVSADGWQYASPSMAGEGEMKDFPLSFNVYAKDNAYEIVTVQFDGEWYYAQEISKSFISVTKENTTITLDCGKPNSGAERQEFVLVIPKKVLDEKMIAPGNYDCVLNADQDNFSDWSEKYVQIAFKQEANQAAQGGFGVLYQGWQPLEVLPADPMAESTQFVASEWGIQPQNIYSVDIAYPESYVVVDPQLSMDIYNGSNYDCFQAQIIGGDMIDKATFEPGFNATGTGATVAFTVNQTMVFIYTDPAMVGSKALILQLPAE